MKLTVDGKVVEVDATHCADLGELVTRAERAAPTSEHRVLVGVAVDGQPLPAEWLADRLPEVAMEGVSEVSIERRPARDVAISVLEQASTYSEEITQSLDRVVDHLRENRPDDGHRLLARVTDALAVLTGITLSVSESLPDAAAELGSLQGEITPWLEETIEAQQAGDPIRLSDVLEYEVRPRVEAWGRLMSACALRAQVESEAVST